MNIKESLSTSIVVLGILVVSVSRAEDTADSEVVKKPETILFVSNREGEKEFHIYRMELDPTTLDAKEAERVDKDDAIKVDAAYSADGEQIFYTSVESLDPLTTAVRVMDADGANVKTLVEAKDAVALDLCVSPDGKRIAYALMEVKKKRTGMRLFFVDSVKGGKPAEVGSAFPLNWSHDGKHLYYHVWHGMPPVYRKLTIANGESSPLPVKKRMSHVLMRESVPLVCFSPDDKSTTFAEITADDGSADILIADADGSNARKILSSRRKAVCIAWSRDGKRLYFSRSFPREKPMIGGDRYDLVALDLESRKERQLTHSAGIHLVGRKDLIPSYLRLSRP